MALIEVVLVIYGAGTFCRSGCRSAAIDRVINDEPLVASVRVTDCVEGKYRRLDEGWRRRWRLNIYRNTALVTSLSKNPVAAAIAMTVFELLTVIGRVYGVEFWKASSHRLCNRSSH